MSSIHFVGGEKGGVGKSVLARLLAQFHIDRQLPFAAFDTDRSHGALLRFYGDFTRPIALEDFESADQLMEAALAAPQTVLVDLAAQTAAPLHRWIEQNDLLALAAAESVPVVFWHVLDDGADGIALLGSLCGHYQGDARYVVVRNYGRGKDFSGLDAAPERAAALALGAAFIDLPELHAATMRKIDHQGTSLWAAAHNRDSGLGLMDRQRVKVWLQRVYQQFDALAPGLFAAAPEPAIVAEPVREPAAEPTWVGATPAYQPSYQPVVQPDPSPAPDAPLEPTPMQPPGGMGGWPG